MFLWFIETRSWNLSGLRISADNQGIIAIMISRIIVMLICYWERISWRFIHMADSEIYPALLTRTPGVEVGNNIRLIGRPRLELYKGSRIIIGDNVALRSRNQYNHLEFYGRVSLISDGKDSLLQIGDRSVIGGACIHADISVLIGSDCLMGANVQIFDCPGHAPCFSSLKDRRKASGTSKPVIIEDYVWLGSNVIVLPGARIGYGSIVVSGSVVSGRFPSYSIIMGNPAKLVIRQKPKEESAEKV